jgi:hypothetical protein
MVIVVAGLTVVLTVAVPRSNAGELYDEIIVVPCDTTITGAGTAVPVAVTLNKRKASLLLIAIWELFVPTEVGLAVIVNVAVAPAAIGPAGVTAPIVKSLLLRVMEEIFKAALPVFSMVIVVIGLTSVLTVAVPIYSCGELFVSIVEPCETTIFGFGMGAPVTLRFNLNAAVASLLFMVIVPVLTPTLVGVAVIVKDAVAPAAIGLAGVNALSTNPLLVVMDEIFNTALPVF